MGDDPQLFDAGGPVRNGRKRGRPKGYVCSPETRAKMSAAKRGDAAKRMATRAANAAKRERREWTPEKDALLGKGYDRVVAIVLGRPIQTVSKRRVKLGIPAYKRRTVRRRAAGYLEIILDRSDPLIAMARKSDRAVLEHRLVMARHLGRPLQRDEFVHHRNGDRVDNRLENLELWTRSHPDGQRVDEMLEWAVEFIERYARGNSALF